VSDLCNAFRKNLAAEIEKYPGTLVALAYRSGYGVSYLRRILKDDRKNPTLLFVECMAESLGISPLSLLEER
jgi:transcriptional regulator with XRE-family HTH domain